MKPLTNHLKTSASVVIGLVLGTGGMVLSSSHTVVLAQSTTPQPLADLNQKDSGDPFSNRGSGQTDGFFNLIHRAIQGPSLSQDDFTNQQRDNLDSAAAEFRARQMERLGNAQGQQSAPATPPATSNNDQ